MEPIKVRKAMDRNLQLLALGGAVLMIALAGLWLAQQGAENRNQPPAEGVVITGAPAVAASSTPTPPVIVPANAPVMPDKVIAHVRQAYPLLEQVDFSCDARGCAVTATIPPPTDEAFLAKRQEMLLGGLAKLVAADGYRMQGPVQMDEVSSNLFHIRAAVVEAR